MLEADPQSVVFAAPAGEQGFGGHDLYSGERFRHLASTIDGSVVDHDDLKAHLGLRDERPQTRPETGLFVACRDDDRNLGAHPR
jgi:hypothetical protein